MLSTFKTVDRFDKVMKELSAENKKEIKELLMKHDLDHGLLTAESIDYGLQQTAEKSGFKQMMERSRGTRGLRFRGSLYFQFLVIASFMFKIARATAVQAATSTMSIFSGNSTSPVWVSCWAAAVLLAYSCRF